MATDLTLVILLSGATLVFVGVLALAWAVRRIRQLLTLSSETQEMLSATSLGDYILSMHREANRGLLAVAAILVLTGVAQILLAGWKS